MLIFQSDIKHGLIEVKNAVQPNALKSRDHRDSTLGWYAARNFARCGIFWGGGRLLGNDTFAINSFE